MEKMRILVVFFALAIYLGPQSAEGDVSFSLLGSSGASYKQFIKQLRDTLTVNSQIVYNIPVLRATATGSARYLLIHLTNYNGESITVGIDVVNVYVVAYRTGTRSFFLKDFPAGAKSVLFQTTTQTTLSYSGNYIGLETAAGTLRENISLGFSEFSSAIGTLFFYQTQSLPRAFLVIIQSVSEAARFKYIEQRVSEHVSTKFTPDPAFLSLQNRWSDLSEQVQLATKNNGVFKRAIEVRSVSNNPILVNDVNSPVVKGIALLLYYKVTMVIGGEEFKVMEDQVNQNQDGDNYVSM